MTKGTIKTLIRHRGFGFINAEDGREIFFHQSGLVKGDFDSLNEGDKVEFEVEKGDKGPRAINISVSAPESA
ncbi:cold shock domain-containing protein [candidate division TA06 bacterium]|nr:cold shock domain-containing protein [candidate division TA06 bacterium]